MDYLRSCYTAPARLIEGSDETFTIRWYRAAADAAVYTAPHAFGSTVWDVPEDIAQHGPGEVPGVRTWSPSNPPAFPGLDSAHNKGFLLTGVPQSVADGPPPLHPCIPFQTMVSKLVFDAEYRLTILAYEADLVLDAEYGGGQRVIRVYEADLVLEVSYTAAVLPIPNYEADLVLDAEYFPSDGRAPGYEADLVLDADFTADTGSVATACCPGDPTPKHLKITFGNTGVRPAWDNRVVTLVWDSGASEWLSGTFTTGQPFSDPMSIEFFCSGSTWTLVITNGLSQTDVNTLTSVVCSPLAVVFTESISTASGMPFTGQTMTVTP